MSGISLFKRKVSGQPRALCKFLAASQHFCIDIEATKMESVEALLLEKLAKGDLSIRVTRSEAGDFYALIGIFFCVAQNILCVELTEVRNFEHSLEFRPHVAVRPNMEYVG